MTAAQAKARLRLADLPDEYVDALVAAATGAIDGADGWLGRAIGVQTWELRVGGLWWGRGDPAPITSPWWQWHGHLPGYSLKLPLPPLRSVDSVKYIDAAGVEQTYPGTNYTVAGVGGAGLLSLADGALWPAVKAGPETLRIRFSCGYDPVPAPILQAIVLQVGQLHAMSGDQAIRSESVEGVGSVTRGLLEGGQAALNNAATALLNPYRVFA